MLMKTLNSSDVMPGDAPHRFDDEGCSKGLAECRVGAGAGTVERRSISFPLTDSSARVRTTDIPVRVDDSVPTGAHVARARAEAAFRSGRVNDPSIVGGLNYGIRGM